MPIQKIHDCVDDLLDEIFLQPWFLPQGTAFRIRDLLPASHQHKMRYYFEDYGCLKCGKRDVTYGSNAMCRICVGQTKLRFLFAIKRRWTAIERAADRKPPNLNRITEAQRLLRDLVDDRHKPGNRLRK